MDHRDSVLGFHIVCTSIHKRRVATLLCQQLKLITLFCNNLQSMYTVVPSLLTFVI